MRQSSTYLRQLISGARLAPNTIPSTHSPAPIPTLTACRLQINVPYLPAPMQCMQCFLHWRNPLLSLSDRMNGHCFTTTVSNPDLPVAIHTQSHKIPFQDCWSVSIIHKLPASTPDHIRRQFEIAYHLVLQSRHTPGLNIR